MDYSRYRKHNDGSHNSRTYHKKDGTSIRAILKREAEDEVKEEFELNARKRKYTKKKKPTSRGKFLAGLPRSVREDFREAYRNLNN